ncbi:hypothetical protein [Bradyrhizobium genosp. P]|uniref:hypothetical protein n=1 Tax=Bradyrhizobium genosp. P TaxID=83641 RepID=UPI003CEF9237
MGHAEAARQDAGVALLPHFIGRPDDRLDICVLDHVPPSRELWIVTRRHDRMLRPVVEDLSLRRYSSKRL